MWWSESERFMAKVSWILLPMLIAAGLLGAIVSKSVLPLVAVLLMLLFGLIGGTVALLPVAAAALLSRVLRSR